MTFASGLTNPQGIALDSSANVYVCESDSGDSSGTHPNAPSVPGSPVSDPPADNYSAEATAAGLAPSDARESAIFANLSNGLYTAIVSGKNATTGAGLVEVYHVAAQTAKSARH